MSSAALALGPSWLDPATLLDGSGAWPLVIASLVIFAECGLLIGFVFPGDTLLFLVGVGVLAPSSSEVRIDAPLWVACLSLSAAAFLGNVVGYEIGRAVGPRIFNKPDSVVFKREHVERAEGFFEKYGAVAIVLARFVPVVRTFITVVAGVAKLDRRFFLTYSAIGGLLWASGMTILGYLLGNIAFIANNVEKLVLLAVAITVIPILFEVIRDRIKRIRGGGKAATTEPTTTSDDVTTPPSA